MYSHTFIKIQFTVCLSTPAVPFGNQRWYFAAWPSFESWLAKMSGGLQHSFLQQCHAFFQVTSERQHPAWQPCKHDPARGPVQLPCACAHDDKDLWRPCWPRASLAPTSFSSVGEQGAGSAAWGRMPSTTAPSLSMLTLLHQNESRGRKWLEAAAGFQWQPLVYQQIIYCVIFFCVRMMPWPVKIFACCVWSTLKCYFWERRLPVSR